MPRKAIAWKEELNKCENHALAKALASSIEALFETDGYLLKRNVHERTIAATFAFHMRGKFGHLNVDAEFNKLGDDPKSVYYDGAKRGIVPDIIVHNRGITHDENLLAVEIKCAKRGKTDRDLRKLKAMRVELKYQYAMFIRFDVGAQAGNITELRWV